VEDVPKASATCMQAPHASRTQVTSHTSMTPPLHASPCALCLQLWADKMEQYLGVRPKNDAEGCLQVGPLPAPWGDGWQLRLHARQRPAAAAAGHGLPPPRALPYPPPPARRAPKARCRAGSTAADLALACLACRTFTGPSDTWVTSPPIRWVPCTRPRCGSKPRRTSQAWTNTSGRVGGSSWAAGMGHAGAAEGGRGGATGVSPSCQHAQPEPV
jgi:hypothetical protein